MRGLALSTLALLVAAASAAGGGVTTTSSSSSIESNGQQQQTHNSLRHDQHNTQQHKQQRDLLQLPNNKTGCEAIHADELPAECACRDPGPYSIVIECLKQFESPHWNDTIGMKIDIDPCNSLGSSISLDITEFNHDIEYPIAGIRAGENKNIPIPGCAIIIPGIGNVGLDAAVAIYGNPDQLTMKIGLNACFGVGQHEVCASQIPGLNTVLPWYVLSGTYSFGDICNSTTTVTKATTPSNAMLVGEDDTAATAIQ